MDSFLWISKENWAVFSSVASVSLVISTFLTTLFNERIRTLIWGDWLPKLLNFISSKMGKIKKFVIQYRDQVIHSEYYIKEKDRDILQLSLLYYAYGEGLSKKIIKEIKRDPVKALNAIGIKTKEEKGKFRILKFSKRFGFIPIPDYDRHLKFLTTFNSLSSSYNLISLVPTIYLMGLIPFRKRLYEPYMKAIVGASCNKGKNEFYSILRKRSYIGQKRRYPYNNLGNFKKVIRLLWVADEAKQTINKRKTNKLKIQVRKENQSYLNVYSEEIGRLGSSMGLSLKEIADIFDSAKVTDSEQELFDNIVKTLWGQLSLKQRKRHRLNGGSPPFERDLTQEIYEILGKTSKVPVEIKTISNTSVIRGEIDRGELKLLVDDEKLESSMVLLEIPKKIGLNKQIYIKPSSITSIKPLVPEGKWNF